MTDTPAGVLMPTMAYRFKVEFDTNGIYGTTLTRSMVKCELDLAKKKITLVMRDDPFGHISKFLFNALPDLSFKVSVLDSQGGNHYAMKVTTSEATHCLRYDYADNDVAHHVVELVIDKFEIV